MQRAAWILGVVDWQALLWGAVKYLWLDWSSRWLIKPWIRRLNGLIHIRISIRHFGWSNLSFKARFDWACTFHLWHWHCCGLPKRSMRSCHWRKLSSITSYGSEILCCQIACRVWIPVADKIVRCAITLAWLCLLCFICVHSWHWDNTPLGRVVTTFA